MTKAIVQTQSTDHEKYKVLVFCCPGCVEITGGSGLHMLPIEENSHKPFWTFDGNLEKPTLSPSIKTNYSQDRICHSFLKNGVFEFCGDSSHSLAGKTAEMLDLPDWILE